MSDGVTCLVGEERRLSDHGVLVPLMALCLVVKGEQVRWLEVAVLSIHRYCLVVREGKAAV